MAEGGVEPGELGAGTAAGGATIEPSLRNALPYFLSLVIFPLVIYAAIHGGWWIACPFAFYMARRRFRVPVR